MNSSGSVPPRGSRGGAVLFIVRQAAPRSGQSAFGPVRKKASDWSPDGRSSLITSGVHFCHWILPLFGDPKPFEFYSSAFECKDGQFSPDGRWIA